MKKIIIFLFIVMLLIILNSNKKDVVVIPSDAIRFRIVANSNDLVDQQLKYHLKSDLTPIIEEISSANNKNTSSYLIKTSIPRIKEIVDTYNISYDINYGTNYFPEKEYHGIKYPAGNYESLVITLGNGLGENWWCVLFPPLCLLEAKADELNDYEYTFFIKDIINKF